MNKSRIRELEKGHLLSRLVILAVVTALLLTAGIFCLRTIVTGIKLFNISNNVSYAIETAENSRDGWNSNLHHMYDEAIEERNALINSDDPFVAFIAETNNLVRLTVLSVLALLVWFFGKYAIKIGRAEKLMFKKYLAYKERQRLAHCS